MRSILIIEDDVAISNAYKAALTQEGYSVHTSLNGPEGLAFLQNTPVDLILLDIMLPQGVNGFDVMRRLKMREETKTIPVVVLTNLDSEKQTAMEEGAKDYVLKSSVDIREFVEKIKRILPSHAS